MDSQMPEREWQFILKEYELVESKWRFLQGLRYAAIASIVTLQASLAATYNIILSTVTNPTSTATLKGILGNTDSYSMDAIFSLSRLQNRVAYPALVFVPCFAIFIMVATRILEARLQDMYAACSERGREIELMLGTPHGIFEKLHHLKRRKTLKMDHSAAFRNIAYITALMWIFPAFMGIYVWYRH